MNRQYKTILRHFDADHLPEDLQRISKPICHLAFWYEAQYPDSPEAEAGLRKLMEAKDCFVRAAVEKRDGESKQ